MLSLLTEAVQSHVPQEQGQDPHHPWHARNPPSQSHPGGCQRCRCLPNWRNWDYSPSKHLKCCSVPCFSADLQVRFLQVARPPDLPALHPSRAALSLRWGHHQRRKQLLTRLLWAPKPLCSQWDWVSLTSFPFWNKKKKNAFSLCLRTDDWNDPVTLWCCYRTNIHVGLSS